MKEKIYAKSISIDVIEKLDRENKIHSIFDNGINIKSRNGLIFMGTDKYGFLPFGIHLGSKDVAKVKNMEIGDFLMFDKKKKRLGSKNGDTIVELDRAHRHPIKLPKGKNMITSDSLNMLFNKVISMNLQTGLDIRINKILEGEEPLLNNVKEISNSQDKKDIELKLRKIIGRGKGLTPAGDDILIGLIWLNEIKSFLSKEFLQVINNLINSEELTTEVSISYYKAALEGKYGGLLIDLCKSLIIRERDKINKSISTIIKLGHSSGIDTLAGIVLGIDIIMDN